MIANEHVSALAVTSSGGAPIRCTLVRGPELAVLVDTRTCDMAHDALHFLEQQPTDPTRLGLIVNTRAHHDHIGANHSVKRVTGALLGAPHGAVPWIEQHETHYAESCLVDPHCPTRSGCETTVSLLGPPSHADLALRERDLLRLGGRVALEALFLRGHVEYELDFIEHRTRTLILGDRVINSGLVEFGPLFHGYENASAYEKTLARLRRLLEMTDFSIVVTSHLPIVCGSQFAAMAGVAQRFFDGVGEDLVEIMQGVAGCDLRAAWEHLCDRYGVRREFRALAMVKSHLVLLVGHGNLTVDANGCYEVA